MDDRTCAVVRCPRSPGKDGLCNLHRNYRTRYGRLPAIAQIMDERERVLAKVDRTGDGCWLWTASASPEGYGHVYFRGRYWQAHRAVWTLLCGEIPEGLQLDHLCYVPRCCRPDHLEPVTPSVNRARVKASARPNLNRHRTEATECAQGHPFNEENTRVRPSGKRNCRECQRVTQRQRRQARRRAA